MRLSALLHPQWMRCGIEAKDKLSALSELVRLVASERSRISADGILSALEARERKGAFSMSKGVAFPHARTEAVQEFTIALGTLAQPLDFQTPDGQKVRIIVLFLIPERHSNLYLQAFASFLNFFSQETHLKAVAQAKTPEEIIAFLDAKGARFKDEATVREVMVPQFVSATPRTTVKEALGLFLASHWGTIPIVDFEGKLVGEVQTLSLVNLGLQGKDSRSPVAEEPFENFLKQYGKTFAKNLPPGAGYVSHPCFVEDTPLLEVATRLSKEEVPWGYVLKDEKVVGVIHINDALRRLTGYHSE